MFKRAVDPLDELVLRAGVEDCWVIVNLDSRTGRKGKAYLRHIILFANYF